ncbi:Site-specific DNA recombinase [Pedococcus dokdonensis]|uniref:Site-specific DNA recombinase n=1 Tax=Pedococcus dokdonensis TaxID=443156 RepID=A0A1H0LVQ9_9MICO|nr:recombinase family protein [Pedococcus dokdonensis]SDO72257.1 Site-specific DNA recombinase [Pedococcus dokdonensis]
MSRTQQQAPVRAAIYARISRDRAGERAGVEQQERECRALAERLGWEVVAVYVDNDISAYKGKPRPQYRAMLDAVRRGDVGGLVAWHTDRLHRRLVDLEELVTLAETKHVEIRTVTAGDVDLSTAGGRMNARILAAVAQQEVEHLRERVQAKRKTMLEAGAYRGGKRPFGYRKGGMVVRPREAEVVARASRDVLAGRSLKGIARELNQQRVRTSSGAEWTSLSLRDVLIRPRNAGLIHTGKASVPTAELTIVGRAQWPALVDEDTWRAVHALLTAPSRRHPNHKTDPSWLLSGIARCGATGPEGQPCGGVIRATSIGATPSRPNITPTAHYRCAEFAHLTVLVPKTDDYVRQVVAEMVRDARVLALLSPSGDDGRMERGRERRAVLVRQIEQTEADYDADLIDARRFKAKTDRIRVELEEVETLLAEGTRAGVALPIVGARDPGQAFLDAPLDVQRQVLRTVLGVQIMPAAYRGAAWSSDRLALSRVGER